MSQPADPYRGDPGYPYQQAYGPPPQPYDRPPYGDQPYRDQPYAGQPYRDQPYGDQPYAGQPYVGQPYGDQRFAAPPTRHQEPPPRPPAPPPRAAGIQRPLRIPGLGLVLTLLSLLVQVLSLTVLPWARFGGNEPGAVATPKVWQLVAEYGGQGFSGWYVMLFSYPLAALSIVLALASVLESVALKMIWGGLALIGLGVLAVRYGLGPLASDQLHFTTQEIIIAIVAVAILIAIIFVLRTAVSTFRRLAGLILLGIAGVHIAAIVDLVNSSNAEQLSIGAYGPAVGYLLTAIAAFIGPRRLRGLSLG
jgi:hypothetical protein